MSLKRQLLRFKVIWRIYVSFSKHTAPRLLAKVIFFQYVGLNSQKSTLGQSLNIDTTGFDQLMQETPQIT